MVTEGATTDRQGNALLASARNANGWGPGDERLLVNLVGASFGIGGIPRYCEELVAHLAGHVEFRHCEVTAAMLAGAPLLRQLPLAVKALDPAAPVHFAKIVGAGVANFRRLPASVATVHDLGYLLWPPERRMFSPTARFFLRLSFLGLRRMDRLIAISGQARRSLVQLLGISPDRIRVVLQGIDHEMFWPRPDARRDLEQRLGIGGWESWKTLLTVGSELPRKDIRTLLRVIDAYRRRGVRVRLLKVGSAGGDRFRTATLREIARLGITDYVQIVDRVSDEELALLYSATDAYVSASVFSHQDAPTMEAMACGAPTIIPTEPDTHEELGPSIVGVSRSTDVEAWLAALDDILSNDAVRDHLRELVVRDAAKFSWERTAGETLAVYTELTSPMATRAPDQAGHAKRFEVARGG